MQKRFKSCAEWPEGVVSNSNGNNITKDEHRSRKEAEAVVRLLEKEGFGGDGEVFPKRTWVECSEDPLELLAFGSWALEPYRKTSRPIGRIIPERGGSCAIPDKPKTKRDRQRENRKQKRRSK